MTWIHTAHCAVDVEREHQIAFLVDIERFKFQLLHVLFSLDGAAYIYVLHKIFSHAWTLNNTAKLKSCQCRTSTFKIRRADALKEPYISM